MQTSLKQEKLFFKRIKQTRSAVFLHKLVDIFCREWCLFLKKPQIILNVYEWEYVTGTFRVRFDPQS